MSNVPSGEASSTKTLWIVLGVVGGIFALCLGVIIVCLLAIFMLGQSASSTFGEVEGTIGS
jgi:hypothetical protein